MQDVNSINQFKNLQHALETEDRQIREIEEKIRRKNVEHRKAKEVFDKVDREVQEFQKEKENLLHRRAQLENDIKALQRSLDDLRKRGASPLKF